MNPPALNADRMLPKQNRTLFSARDFFGPIASAATPASKEPMTPPAKTAPIHGNRDQALRFASELDKKYAKSIRFDRLCQQLRLLGGVGFTESCMTSLCISWGRG